MAVFQRFMFLFALCCSNAQKFPDDFKFGVATSAYQIEGGWNDDGKGVSVWDRIVHQTPLFIKDQSNGDVACDSYNQWERDVEMLKELGVQQYRFSLSWTRILPGGYNSAVNTAGVEYYNKLINKLLENGIEPIATLYHWDMPQKVSALGGLSNSIFVDYFANYARTAFDLFGDRVKTWITFNEPSIICAHFNNYLAQNNPEFPSGVVEYLCTHNLLKSHAEAYHIYDREFRLTQKGRIGITLNFEWSEPDGDAPEDIEAAERRRQFDFGIFAHPIVHFDYPQIVKDRVAERSTIEQFPTSKLQRFTLAEKTRLKGTYDFLGLNHYTTWLVKNTEEPSVDQRGFYVDTKIQRRQDPTWPLTAAADNRVVPWGLRRSLAWIKKTYNNPEILITECGFSHENDELLEDPARTNFYKEYLQAALEAIVEDEVRLTAFMAWSLMDNFEWVEGYLVKFGLYHVDFEDPERKRTPRASAEYYKTVIATRELN